MMTRFSLRLLAVCGALSVLVACGGGGGGGGTTEVVATELPATPVLSLGFGIKQLQFSWPAATGASYYRLLENPDGVSGYTQVGGNITTTSATLDISVHRHDWPNARYMIEACNSLGCTASNEVNTVDSALKPIGYFKPTPAPVVGDNFSQAALSEDGNTLAVGALEGGSSGNGTVYLYARSTAGLWGLQATLVASNRDLDDWFGNSLALSSDGNTLAVGAPNEDGSGHGINPVPDNAASDSGAVYLFSRSGTTWSAPVYIKASDLAKGFGTAVDLSVDGNLLAVGAPNSADGGHAYTFIRTSGVWSEKQKLIGANTASGDSFGSSLALSGDGRVLAVGAPLEDSSTTGVNSTPDDLATDAGAVYIFSYINGTTMSQYGYLKAYNTGAGDWFGHSVSLSFDAIYNYYSLFVGAPKEDSNAAGVCIFDDAACITAQADNSAADAGAAYFYYSSNGISWSKRSYLKASNTGAGDQFGNSLAQSGDSFTLAVGALREAGSSPGIDGAYNDNSPFSGAVYLFTKIDTITWNHSTYVKAPTIDLTDYFGTSVALSGDGSTMAVGVIGEDSNSTLICATGDAACAAAQADNSVASAGALYLY